VKRTIITATVLAVGLIGGGAAVAKPPSGAPNNTHGICKAYFAGSEKGKEQKRKAPPFKALEAAAEAADMTVEEYCLANGQNPGNGGGGGSTPPGGGGGGTTPPPAGERCTAEDEDTAGIFGDTIAQQVFESPLGALPILVNPEAGGPVSGTVESLGDGTELDVVTNEAGCAASATVVPL
jgi:hypothetical protein